MGEGDGPVAIRFDASLNKALESASFHFPQHP